jgi:hypothetical protein
MSKFQLNWITPKQQFKPGTKVEITEGYLKGELATVEVNPETGKRSQRDGNCVEVWIRYEKDGEKVGRAILLPQWQDISQLRVVE